MRVETPPPAELPDLLVERLRAGTSGAALAVLDPTWPQALVGAARAALAAAATRGRLHADDLVLFTSGSSGRPKGVVRSAASWQASLGPLSELTGIGPDDEVWLPVPLSSGLSLYGAVHAAAVGARWVTGTPHAPLPASATATHVVPGLLERLCADVEQGAPSRLRRVVVAGAPLPVPLRERAERLGWSVTEYYGAAELSFVGYRLASGPMTAFPGADVRIADDGELWARSPYLCRGYLADEPGGVLRRDGDWATVGDRARAAADGWEVVGRGDAAVTTGGHTVVVEEVESALRQVPDVADVAVLGLPHAGLGELLVAVVVPLPGLRRADLDRAVKALPAPARPRRWLRAPALPRTSGGKLARAEVRSMISTLPPLP